MSHDDAVIARGLNTGLRQLLVAAFVHHAGPDAGKLAAIHETLLGEIGRLVFKAEGDKSGDADLTAAMREALTILLNAAHRDAEGRLGRMYEVLQ